MGDWQTDWSRDVLERIVALLFALANLADLAAGVSFLRRRRVLSIVSHGEVEARAFVIGMASGTPVQADALEIDRDAAPLAVRLRALALMLCILLTRTALLGLPGVTSPQTGQSEAAVSAGCRAPPLATDTS